jgi:hypothetical protein
VLCNPQDADWRALEPISRLVWRKDGGTHRVTGTPYGTSSLSTTTQASPCFPAPGMADSVRQGRRPSTEEAVGGGDEPPWCAPSPAGPCLVGHVRHASSAVPLAHRARPAPRAMSSSTSSFSGAASMPAHGSPIAHPTSSAPQRGPTVATQNTEYALAVLRGRSSPWPLVPARAAARGYHAGVEV